ncbi:hypothetical protein OCU04_007875 [Sclerotinia nivalis]|uniref:Transposase Tc1-like domain-containing protein n=1 Tax=Sclerotinia nivalis TaxID=352851 RepID=A0A9X0AJN4_9HELO|nr:hypothetical protein OCU04_007875 [Sclerotinia nivalis]
MNYLLNMSTPRIPLGSININEVAFKHLTLYMRGKIIGKAEEGARPTKIGRELGIPQSTISYTIKQDSLRNEGASLPKKTRKKSYTERDERILIRYIRLYPKAIYKEVKKVCGLDCSITTIKRILKNHRILNWRAKRRPFLTQEHALKRLAWCLTMRGLTVEEWGLIFWSDECSVERGRGKKNEWVFRTPPQKWDRNMVQTYITNKNMKVMVWGGLL